MNTRQALVKRCFDIVVSALGLLFFWPIIAICWLVAGLDTGKNGIYSQRRIGRHSTVFTIYKIRTMINEEETETNTVTIDRDPRISSSGRFFRRLKLDELPQLWNVLIGEMSFVGPRPDVPGYADRLAKGDRRILSIRPGITGPATIKYRLEEKILALQPDPIAYNKNVIFPDKVKINLRYLDEWTLLLDISYILITIGVFSPPSSLVGYEPMEGR